MPTRLPTNWPNKYQQFVYWPIEGTWLVTRLPAGWMVVSTKRLWDLCGGLPASALTFSCVIRLLIFIAQRNFVVFSAVLGNLATPEIEAATTSLWAKNSCEFASKSVKALPFALVNFLTTIAGLPWCSPIFVGGKRPTIFPTSNELSAEASCSWIGEQ